MADVVQTISMEPTVFPFAQGPFSDPGRKDAAVPWGQAVFNKAFQSDAIAAGNTGTLVIDFRLPKNYCCLLRSLHTSTAGTGANNWNLGVLGLAYQDPGGPYKNTMAALPETDYLWWNYYPTADIGVRNRSSATTLYKTWRVGGPSGVTSTSAVVVGYDTVDNPVNVPLWVGPDYPGSDMVVYIENDIASSIANNFRCNAVFDLYTQDQAFAPEVMGSPRRMST